ncbi:MAG: hypothetical protein K2K44_03430, partial [Oscillospiraceae bacterium]|nr:hypothetical protein [Oscillospiraceae bacterium]
MGCSDISNQSFPVSPYWQQAENTLTIIILQNQPYVKSLKEKIFLNIAHLDVIFGIILQSNTNFCKIRRHNLIQKHIRSKLNARTNQR